MGMPRRFLLLGQIWVDVKKGLGFRTDRVHVKKLRFSKGLGLEFNVGYYDG